MSDKIPTREEIERQAAAGMPLASDNKPHDLTQTASHDTAGKAIPNEPEPAPPHITPEDAREEQSIESMYWSGTIPKGSLAAQMQSSADKIAYAKRMSEG